MLKWINHPPPSPLLPPDGVTSFLAPAALTGNTCYYNWEMQPMQCGNLWKHTLSGKQFEDSHEITSLDRVTSFPAPVFVDKQPVPLLGPNTVCCSHTTLSRADSFWRLVLTHILPVILCLMLLLTSTAVHCGCNDFSIVSFLHYCVLYTKVCRS